MESLFEAGLRKKTADGAVLCSSLVLNIGQYGIIFRNSVEQKERADGTILFFLLVLYGINTYFHLSKKRVMKNLVASLFVSFMLLSACAHKENAVAVGVADQTLGYAEERTSTGFAGGADIASSEPALAPQLAIGNTQSNAAITVTQKIIKTANLHFQVSDVATSRNNIAGLIKKHGGYITNESGGNSGYELTQYMEIRIPADSFDLLIPFIMKESIFTNSNQIGSQDVTEEYVDISARLKSKKEVEATYLNLLKKAEKVKDILEVENSLRVVREEIESIEGRLRYMNSRIAESTITINMYQKMDYVSGPKVGFFASIKESFVRGWEHLLGLIQWMIAQWPFLLIGAIITVLIIRRKKSS